MDDFTDALIVALRAGADDPDRNAMGSRMKALVGELTKKEASKDEPSVEIVEDTKAEKANESPEDDLLQATNNLKRQLEYEQQARADAERRAYEATYHAQMAKNETIDAQYQMVQNAIDTLKGRSENLKSALSEAHSVGDYDKVAQLQEAISINTNQLSDLKRGEKAMKEQIQQLQITL